MVIKCKITRATLINIIDLLAENRHNAIFVEKVPTKTTEI